MKEEGDMRRAKISYKEKEGRKVNKREENETKDSKEKERDRRN